MRKNWLTAVICVVIAVTFFVAGFFTRNVFDALSPKYEIIFSQNVSRENIINFNKVKSLLLNSYYEEIDEDVLLEGAIKGMVEAVGDPYTVYYTPDMMKSFMEQQTGSYVGIGVTVFMDDDGLATVADIFDNSPAKAAGMRNGDKIVMVNGEDVTEITDLNLIVQKIKGLPDTEVVLMVYRPEINNYVELSMVRKVINIQYIESRMINDDIGYIQLKLFDEDIAQDFVNHVNKLIAAGAKGLILDLRNNPGGDYSQVVRMADFIVPEGLIVYTEDRNGNRQEEKSGSGELNMPLVVLINEYSASASEILSAAIKEYGKGTLIGKTTFGKGLVQTIIPLEGNAGLKFTTARYFTPSGVSIHGVGVTPDIEVSNDEKYRYYSIDEIPEGEDKQLLRAIDEVSRLISEKEHNK
ncbi:carboxy-terminal-processing protease CtpA [Thermoclostridium stercorarium subsp. stercorarium DSM 8532]|jgi:carboxyl-terminal processing protease|uniref:Carboxy-terminal-processing protease CtpA n=3 Tax=Thermoclostridium stercorarium TaxID=1510 RepID=L7VKW1_THES1|nr:S41 family peptidase [Thermoclostridium stercorarium]AGC67387.1 carboxy-terminal-processing protease CtpA [Thermoclostridium stercorarium subsp. stercorarium DSM 8532]AGI38447.1 peptidase [Thermoclostridium stercorarium subsp. stercorarium DSM 8532]ANW97878.1 peptidase S41 [Thermoclostridium stercorarium subsp. thermolacticum DSM 2910]ANX00430.1 peptidase S41 [Thermoclostridium stercorarium subsp. leptospartum DSM 9219]UZQ85976.1 S41 family peptidase [Thermoclostridium stercorarium]